MQKVIKKRTILWELCSIKYDNRSTSIWNINKKSSSYRIVSYRNVYRPPVHLNWWTLSCLLRFSGHLMDIIEYIETLIAVLRPQQQQQQQ